MGIMDSLLGDPGGVELNPHQENALQQGWLQAPDLLNYSQAMDQFYPFSTVAAMNPLQGAGLQSQAGYAQSGMAPLIGQSQAAWGQQLNPMTDPAYQMALGGAANMAQGGMDPYIQNLLGYQTGNAADLFNQTLNTGIQANAVGAGAFGGSDMMKSQNAAFNELSEDVLGSQLGLLSNAYGQNLNQQQAGVNALSNLYGQGASNVNTALGMAGSQAGLGLLPGQTLTGVGDIYQGQTQAQLGDLMARQDYAQQHPWDLLGMYNQVVGNPYGMQDAGTNGLLGELGSFMGNIGLGF